MRKLSIFKNSLFGEVGVISIDGSLLFEISGVIKALKLDNLYIEDQFIDQGELYRLIFKSKSPYSLTFESWISDEVIPAMKAQESTNNSKLPSTDLLNEDLMIHLFQTLENQNNSIKKLQQDVETSMYYTNLARTVEMCKEDIPIGTFAKLIYGKKVYMGRNQLFEWFRKEGYLMKENGQNVPKQIYIEQGLFKIRQMAINTSNGPQLRITPYITPKGQLYFINKVMEGVYNERAKLMQISTWK